VGTTTLALATAYVLVRDPGVEVLLIDAHARQEGSVILPGLEPGLIQLGRGLAKPAEVVFPTDHGGLHYLPRGSGSYNGPKLFGQLAPMFDEMRRRFDYVILDAAPMVTAPESAYLARVCEGVVIVLASERTPKAEAIRVRELLDENGAHVLGTALNRARRSSLFGRR
jgi:Mrp family chromosome partitioning ATPase